MGVVGAGVEIEGNALRYEYRVNIFPVHNKNDVSNLHASQAIDAWQTLPAMVKANGPTSPWLNFGWRPLSFYDFPVT